MSGERPDGTPTVQWYLDRISRQNDAQTAKIDDLRGRVEEMRTEVAATYAREIDCLGRRDQERTDRAGLAQRVFKDIGDHKERLDRHSSRISKLEGDRREETGAQQVIKTQRQERRELFFKWAAAVLIAASLAIGGWIFRLLTE